LPNVGPYIYDVSISDFTINSIYIYDIISLRVKIITDWQFTDYVIKLGTAISDYSKRVLRPIRKTN